MGFLTKIQSAYEPWNDPKLSEHEKKYWSDPKVQKSFKDSSKARTELKDIQEKTSTLLSSIQVYLSDLDTCPDDNEMVKVPKKDIEKIQKEAYEIKKLEQKWYKLIHSISEVIKE